MGPYFFQNNASFSTVMVNNEYSNIYEPKSSAFFFFFFFFLFILHLVNYSHIISWVYSNYVYSFFLVSGPVFTKRS